MASTSQSLLCPSTAWRCRPALSRDFCRTGWHREGRRRYPEQTNPLRTLGHPEHERWQHQRQLPQQMRRCSSGKSNSTQTVVAETQVELPVKPVLSAATEDNCPSIANLGKHRHIPHCLCCKLSLMLTTVQHTKQRNRKEQLQSLYTCASCICVGTACLSPCAACMYACTACLQTCAACLYACTACMYACAACTASH